MASHFSDFAVLNDANDVGIANRTQSMRDDKCGPSFNEPHEGALHL